MFRRAPAASRLCGNLRIPTTRLALRAIYQANTPSRFTHQLAPRSSSSKGHDRPSFGPLYQTLGSATLATFAIVGVCLCSTEVHAEAQESPPKIRLSEVHEHGRDAERFWVIKGTRVYDITEWIPNHPGGSVILRAAGGSIDGYWNIFSIHQKQDVYDILEQYYIGDIDPIDLVNGQVPAEHIDDPFANDPQRDPRLKVHGDRPCNAETPGSELKDHITPNNIFYVRNHLWVPNHQEDDGHEITIEFEDGEEKTVTLGEIRSKFQEHTVTAVLQCSGNRRSHMTTGSRPTQGLQWGVGAIGNAEWTGVWLRDVLQDAGLDTNDLPDEVRHVQFSGSEAYGASIPIEKAVDKRGDVLLAYKMNGEPLPRDHGWPVRIIVPGHVAARSVKWVNKITLSEEESPSQWQRRDYKCFGPNQGPNPDWDSAPAIQETPVQSAVTRYLDRRPGDSKTLEGCSPKEDSVSLEGYAYAGGGRRIVRVDVSPDGGRTWKQADFLENPSKGYKAWGWSRWQIAIPRDQAERSFVIKAVDEANNVQPESHEPHYNFRGNLATAWQRIPYDRPG